MKLRLNVSNLLFLLTDHILMYLKCGYHHNYGCIVGIYLYHTMRAVYINYYTSGGQDVNNGVIERRYGYTPNPRWPKNNTRSSSDRFYEPKGVQHRSEDQVPGVTFRNDCKSKVGNHSLSFKENEFPELGSINSDRYVGEGGEMYDGENMRNIKFWIYLNRRTNMMSLISFKKEKRTASHIH